MTIIDILIKNSIYIFLPISLYINYINYIKNLEIKENKFILEFAIASILILMVRYNEIPTYPFIILLQIAPLINLKLKDTKNYFLLFLIIIIYNQIFHTIYPLILLIKMLIYSLIFLKIKSDNKQNVIIFIVELLALCFQKNLSLNIYITSFISIIYAITITSIIIKLLEKSSKIIDLNNVIKELEREKLLRSSISKLTHELKNPIAVCKGYLEMMNLKDKEKSIKYLEIISGEISRSKTIIDEFSDFGKLKKIEPDEMDITYLLEDVKSILEPLFKKNKANLSLSETKEIYINGDYNKLKQVFINLLKNTIEAQKEDVQLNVKIKLINKKKELIIKIIDNGIGMSKETLAHVSEVFFTTKQNGTGIGLAFSKEVIELHNGTLAIETELNKGTTIIISLPR